MAHRQLNATCLQVACQLYVRHVYIAPRAFCVSGLAPRLPKLSLMSFPSLRSLGRAQVYAVMDTRAASNVAGDKAHMTNTCNVQARQHMYARQDKTYARQGHDARKDNASARKVQDKRRQVQDKCKTRVQVQMQGSNAMTRKTRACNTHSDLSSRSIFPSARAASPGLWCWEAAPTCLRPPCAAEAELDAGQGAQLPQSVPSTGGFLKFKLLEFNLRGSPPQFPL